MPGAPLQCRVLRASAELGRLEPAWQDLLRRSPANEPTLGPLWLRTWWSVYGRGGGRRLRVGSFWEGERLVGLAPLHQRLSWYRHCLPFRRLEPLGADVDEGDGVGSDYLNVLAEGGAEGRVAGALAGALAAGAFGSWDEVVLPALAGDGPWPGLLVEAFTRAGVPAGREEAGEAPYIPLPASWEDYVGRLTPNRRHFLRHSLRDFERWAGGEARFCRVGSPAELAEGLRILAALHGERWGAAGQPGVFGSPRFAAFHDTVLRGLLAEGALDLLWLSVRGRPVAALYNIVWNGKVYAYQSGRKPYLPGAVRPGIALHAHAIRAAIAAGLREYDFLAGAARYKTQLAPASRPLVRVRAVRPCLREQVRRLAEAGIARARPWRQAARNVLPSPPSRAKDAPRP